MHFEISSKARSFNFPEENVKVVVQPDSTIHESKAMKLCITPRHHPEYTEGKQDIKMSKIYDFSPSGFVSQQKLMVVIPLFPSHSYSYEDMTLMYREDSSSEFVSAENLKRHRPNWAFNRNKCYIFLNHFCGIYVSKSFWQTVKGITLNALLFYKYNKDNLELLELKTTFGCYAEESKCSKDEVIKVINPYCEAIESY